MNKKTTCYINDLFNYINDPFIITIFLIFILNKTCLNIYKYNNILLKK